MLDSIIDVITEFPTLLAQAAVSYIADHSSIKKDGVTFFLIKIVVSAFIYLAVFVGTLFAGFILIFKVAIPIFFSYVLPLFFS